MEERQREYVMEEGIRFRDVHGFLYARRDCMNTDRADAPSFVYKDKLPDFLTTDAKAGTTLTGMRGGATMGARRQSDDRGREDGSRLQCLHSRECGNDWRQG